MNKLFDLNSLYLSDFVKKNNTIKTDDARRKPKT